MRMVSTVSLDVKVEISPAADENDETEWAVGQIGTLVDVEALSSVLSTHDLIDDGAELSVGCHFTLVSKLYLFVGPFTTCA